MSERGQALVLALVILCALTPAAATIALLTFSGVQSATRESNSFAADALAEGAVNAAVSSIEAGDTPGTGSYLLGADGSGQWSTSIIFDADKGIEYVIRGTGSRNGVTHEADGVWSGGVLRTVAP